MAYRVAAASTDGIVINQHFGHADKFHIVEISPDDGTYKFLETRNVTPCCQCGDHELSAFDALLEQLKDVQAVLVSRIGDGASDYLEQHGVTAYQAPYVLKSVLEKIIKDKLWEVDKWQFHTKN